MAETDPGFSVGNTRFSSAVLPETMLKYTTACDMFIAAYILA